MGRMIAREVAQRILGQLPSQLDEPGFVFAGIGGAGINVLKLVRERTALRKLAVDTDEYFLSLCGCQQQLDLSNPISRGKGTIGDVELGKSAALLHKEEIAESLEQDIILLAAGLGRGTGTGAAPVVASLAKEKGLPVLAFLIWPFKEERIVTKARRGLDALKPQCDALLILDNNAALEVDGVESHWEAANVVNDMMAHMVERLVEKVSTAFPFSIQDEIVDFVEELPAANEKFPLKAAELAIAPQSFEPIAMDARGLIELR
ncbi:MAG: hypothetical protein LN412_04640 [Candidatus Thermoplasmatota archaeon]|nr:hypothetical protein [Candidatus Thermoplasmatota archaeon]